VGNRLKVTFTGSPKYISDDFTGLRKTQLAVTSKLIEEAREGAEHLAEI
jgi:hypothetical protein